MMGNKDRKVEDYVVAGRIKIAASVCPDDAGEAMRALEIMKTIRGTAPSGCVVEGVFFTHGGAFGQKFVDEGFSLQRVTPVMGGGGYLRDLRPTATNFIGDKELATKLLQGEIDALGACRPDLILHGFWPCAGIARRMVDPPVPAVCFLPLPLEPSMFATNLLREIPDQAGPLARLPKVVQRWIMRRIPAELKLRAPILRQDNLIQASGSCGWARAPMQNLFEMLSADLTLVNDLSCFYQGLMMPDRFVLTGPLNLSAGVHTDVDPAIASVFERQRPDQVNLFCTMGSSAREGFLLEAVRAIASLPAERFHAVVLVPKAICPLERIAPLVTGRPNTFVTDEFVPARQVNALSDLTICHGGQGTIQASLAAGCPMVGFAMQPEQQINLDNVAAAGAGIRIASARWKGTVVAKTIREVAGDSRYQNAAQGLRDEMLHEDARAKISSAVWGLVSDLMAARTDEQGGTHSS